MHDDPIYFAPQRKFPYGWVAYKESPSPPPPPDYAGAATAQQKSQMSSQYTPYGTQVYSNDASSPSGYRSDITLDPRAQKTLDSQMALSSNLGDLANKQLGQVNQQYSHPMDLSSVQGVADQSYKNFTSRLDPQWAAREEHQKAELANQGLVAGGEAYDNSMRDFNNSRNDAYTQANQASINTMPQTYQLALSQYQQPLNQLNAIRTGAQVQNPQFTQSPGAPMLGAAQAQGQYDQGLYNANVGQQNSMMGGLMGLGGAAMMSPAGTFAGPTGLLAISDRRLKSNIERIGTHPLGIGIYEYDIFGSRAVGVMADELIEVRPEAVLLHPSGYFMVDYGAI